MIKRLILLIITILLSLNLTLPTAHAQESDAPPPEETLEAVVSQILQEKTVVFESQEQTLQQLELLITKGSLKGRTVQIEGVNIQTTNAQKYSVGDKVLVTYTQTSDGDQFFFITDYIRRQELLLLFLVFVMLVTIVGGLHGATSLIGMTLSFAIIFLFILPRIVAGNNPVTITLVGSAIIAPITFYISHGWNKKTHIAITSTLITLFITGIIATVTVNTLRLSGFSSEEAGFLQNAVHGILNMKGILLAGIIISVLGILDDITVTQASIVEQVKQTNPKVTMSILFTRAMKVGRDHIASLVNTLILVYTGASLPLLLLFVDNPHPFGEVINYEFLAEEVARTLIGSIGLVLAVPISTYIASVVFSKKKWIKSNWRL